MKKIYFLFLILIIFPHSISCAGNRVVENKKVLNDEEKCLQEKNADSCTKVALKYKYSKNIKIADSENFLKWAEKGCEYKSAIACYSLSYFHYAGDGVEVNKEKSYDYLLKACDAFKFDASRDKEYYKKTSLNICLVLAERYLSKKDGHRDLQKALGVSVLECDNGQRVGCLYAGMIYEEMGDEKKSEKQFDLNCCKKKETMSCILLIEKYLKTGNKGKVDYYYNKLPGTMPAKKEGFIPWAKIVWDLKKDIDSAIGILNLGIVLELLSIEEVESDKRLQEIRNTEEYKEMIKRKIKK